VPSPPPDDPIQLRPIGTIRCGYAEKREAPRQGAAGGGLATLVLLPGLAHAVEDLDGFDRVWLIFWFHLVRNYSPKVLPPRSTKRRGVLATRSPHRPNPIGLTAARLLGREGCVLHLDEVDLVDGTPVLDVKPYLAYADAFPEARAGWLEEEGGSGSAGGGGSACGRVGAGGGAPARDPIQPWTVTFGPGAERALAWLAARGVELRVGFAQQLALGPHPHPYRRIRRVGGALQIAVKEWRARFTVEGRSICVERILSGYKRQELVDGEGPALALHRDFLRESSAEFPSVG
jgi:tRNA-Thr(GGU) m(6)t(6)A37 methyltransferase TsaA